MKLTKWLHSRRFCEGSTHHLSKFDPFSIFTSQFLPVRFRQKVMIKFENALFRITFDLIELVSRGKDERLNVFSKRILYVKTVETGST